MLFDPVDHHPAKIRYAERIFGRELEFKDIKIPGKLRDIYYKNEKKWIYITVYLYKTRITIYNFSILVQEDNTKQNPDNSYTKKYQKYVVFSYSYKLVCVNDKFSKTFKPIFRQRWWL